MKSDKPKIIANEGAWWYVVWGYIVAGLTVLVIIVAVVTMMKTEGWGVLMMAFYGILAMLVLLLVGVVFRHEIAAQKVLNSCRTRVETAYNMLLAPAFGMLVIVICAMIFVAV